MVVGLANEVVARNILQTPGNMVGMYSGAGSNAMTLNTFSYKGNRVRLVVIPQIGEAMEDGTTLGNAYNWFVLNPRFLKDALALRAFKLYDTVMKNYENDDNDDLAVSIRGSFAVDHYAAEAGIYGSSATS